jgi:GNAT superfamily N-acetyltransferase
MRSTIARVASSRPADEIDRAIDVFVRGFSFTRSFTHPYDVDRVGPLWVTRDGPRTSGDYRREEWIGRGVPATEVDAIARRHTRGRFAVCDVLGAAEPDQSFRAAWKAAGYRLGTTEPLMVHDLMRIPRCDCPATVERVTTQPLADRLAKVARSRQILAEHLAAGDRAPLRQYVAIIDEQIVGWVRSIMTPAGTWCSNMFVARPWRRRGIGRAMLCRMLRDDRDHGAELAVLTASHTGALLYPLVGYRRIATLYLYTRRKRENLSNAATNDEGSKADKLAPAK